MKKVFSILLIVMFVFSMNIAFAADDDFDTIDINLDVEAGIAIDCGDNVVTMGAIVQDGFSDLTNNSQACKVRTNNQDGYTLSIKGSGTNGNTLVSEHSDVIPAISDTPAGWTVADDASGWGFTYTNSGSQAQTTLYDGVGSSGTTYAGDWAGVTGTSVDVATFGDHTIEAGADNIFMFGAEVGTDYIQPTGTYVGQVTVTATTL